MNFLHLQLIFRKKKKDCIGNKNIYYIDILIILNMSYLFFICIYTYININYKCRSSLREL